MRMASFEKKLLGLAVGLVTLIAGVTCVLYIGSRSYSQFKRAELAFRATSLSIQAVEAYVVATGKWPSSWSSLRSCEATEKVAISPKEWDDFERMVDIDFTRTVADVAEEDAATFDAIRPRWPTFSTYRGLLMRLHQATKEIHLRNTPEAG